MGADSVTVYYGIRYQVVDPEEVRQLMLGKHPLVKLAKRFKLDHYWGNFSIDGVDYHLLYIGTELGSFGGEGKFELEIADEKYGKIQRDTRKRIESAEFSLKPALFIQFEPDI